MSIRWRYIFLIPDLVRLNILLSNHVHYEYIIVLWLDGCNFVFRVWKNNCHYSFGVIGLQEEEDVQEISFFNIWSSNFSKSLLLVSAFSNLFLAKPKIRQLQLCPSLSIFAPFNSVYFLWQKSTERDHFKVRKW